MLKALLSKVWTWITTLQNALLDRMTEQVMPEYKIT